MSDLAVTVCSKPHRGTPQVICAQWHAELREHVASNPTFEKGAISRFGILGTRQRCKNVYRRVEQKEPGSVRLH
jgi:hypothetical protein